MKKTTSKTAKLTTKTTTPAKAARSATPSKLSTKATKTATSTKTAAAKSVKSTATKAAKPALIFIHGYRGAPLGLAELGNFFANDYRVFIPPMPPTEQMLEEYTPATYANYLANFIRNHRLKQPILIGHSMGSIIAAATAAEYPSLVNDQIIFLAPIATHPPHFITRLTPLVSVLSNHLISLITTRYLFASKVDSKTDKAQTTRALYHKCLRLTVKCGEACTFKRHSRLAANFSCHYGISDFDFSATPLFILGSGDRLTNKKDLKRLIKKHPGSRLSVISNCGHLLNYEKPAEVAKTIKKYLKK